MIMRASLQHRAANTYYGQWPAEQAAIHEPEMATHWP
jgi:hypothetical protein